jgi:PIN domain nuclease of toxin-antitoxin system
VILLDTHALFWMATDSSRLSKQAREAIRQARHNGARQETGIAIATISLWELAWLAHNGRIMVVGSVESFVRETISRVILKPVTAEIAALGVRLPKNFPKDPADRLIASTAIVEGIPLITADASIRQSKVVQTIW